MIVPWFDSFFVRDRPGDLFLFLKDEYADYPDKKPEKAVKTPPDTPLQS